MEETTPEEFDRAQAANVKGNRMASSPSRRLLVVGGSGYLGRHIVRAGLAKGLSVSSFSRTGPPPIGADDLGDVEWLRGSLENADDVQQALEGKHAMVTCVGTPFGPSRERVRQVNGDLNVALIGAAKGAGVERCVFVSAATFRLMESLFPDSWGAYFEGKRLAEEAVAEHFGGKGCVLRPGIMYTSTLAEAREQAALGAKEAKMPNVVGGPMAAILSQSPVQWARRQVGPVGDFFEPPLPVNDVAAAAMAHILRDD